MQQTFYTLHKPTLQTTKFERNEIHNLTTVTKYATNVLYFEVIYIRSSKFIGTLYLL